MKMKLLSLLTVLISLNVFAQLHDEAVDGDLSNEFDNPTGPFVLEAGEGLLTANQQSGDVDYVSFIIPEGLELDALILEDYTAEGNNNEAFLGMQEGLAFTTDAMSTTAADLLGGITYGSLDLDTNLLIDMNNIGEGFEIPLPSGNYTLWLNQTGPISEATLKFVVTSNLSLADNTLENSITIFPNPARESITIKSKALLDIQNVSIIDITGKEVRTYNQTSLLNVSTLPAGVYFGIITTNEGSVTRKIIKE